MKKESGVSLYYQIKEELREKISPMPVGTKLDTEMQLAGQFGVSRGTVRQAITDLVNEGLLTRVQGSGTFRASSHRPQTPYYVSKSFTQQIMDSGHSTGVMAVTCSRVRANSRIAEYLNIPIGSWVHRLTRLRTVDGQPYALATAYIRTEWLPNFQKNDLELSLIQLLQEKYHLELTNQHSYCYAKLADAKLAKQLSIPVDSAIMQIDYVCSLGTYGPLFVDVFQFTNSYVLHLEAPEPMRI